MLIDPAKPPAWRCRWPHKTASELLPRGFSNEIKEMIIEIMVDVAAATTQLEKSANLMCLYFHGNDQTRNINHE